MKDAKYILIFIAAGLGLAFAFSGPLRRPPQQQEIVGTPLRETANVYAEGTIDLDQALKTKSAQAPVLFIMAKAGAGGPPLAVKKITLPTFPLSFSLTTKDNMVGEDFFDGDIQITARLDQDGTAGPKQPGDLEATAQIPKGKARSVNLLFKG